MPAVDLNGLRLLRFDHDPYERDSDEEDEYEGNIEPEPDEVLIKTKLGNVRFWLMDHEASNFAAALFNRRGHIKSKLAHEGWGVWGRELNADAVVAYLQEIRGDKEVRNQGIGSWALREILRCNVLYLDGAHFIYALPCDFTLSGLVRAPGLGFRRVGTTAYFCCARTLSHLSDAVPANTDADKVEPANPFAGMDPTMARAMTVLSRQNLI
ncbi:hypothetical protein RHOSPDRAFT_31522 [Rhodotorula sp. JG-1b]|nr:hypothetical protein RHOSPDRAFT_31522 [Rhodotorula sp. JG-1b]